jgi:hypothetical protein
MIKSSFQKKKKIRFVHFYVASVAEGCSNLGVSWVAANTFLHIISQKAFRSVTFLIAFHYCSLFILHSREMLRWNVDWNKFLSWVDAFLWYPLVAVITFPSTNIWSYSRHFPPVYVFWVDETKYDLLYAHLMPTCLVRVWFVVENMQLQRYPTSRKKGTAKLKLVNK